MARVATLTFHTAVNYGAVLQAYALIDAIRRLGHTAEIIDYEPEALRLAHNRTLRDCRGVRAVVKHVVSYAPHRRRRRLFQEFVHKCIGTSSRLYKAVDFAVAAADYDVVIVGSDQVWNPALTDHDSTFLLVGFEHGALRKVSYAASLGNPALPDDFVEVARGALADFDAISVREVSAAITLKQQVGVDAEVVLDPVFLMTPEGWREFAEDPRRDKPYAFLYLVSANREAERRAREIAQRRGLELVVVHKQYWRRVPGAANLMQASPAQFVGLIDGADEIITNSFHGMAFAAILGKAATITLNKSKNSRLTDLARQLAGESAGLVQIDEHEIRISERTGVAPVLDDGRRTSEAFLRSAIVADHDVEN